MSQTWTGFETTPYETAAARIGRRGLNLGKAIDQLAPEELARLVNMRSLYGGVLEIRPGQTASGTTTGTDRIHSLYRLNDPAAGLYARFAGSAAALYRGTTGGYSSVDSGYSGDPITFMGTTAPQTGVPYVFALDRSRMRKFSRTGSVTVIGLPIPAGPLVTSVNTSEATTNICRFDNTDGNGHSEAAQWTLTAGSGGGNAPTAADAGAAVTFTTVVGGAAAGYSSICSIARSPVVNAAVITDLAIAAVDQDLIRFYLTLDRPDYLEEVRIYFVCTGFTAGVIPGTSTTQNLNAFWKSFRPNELTSFLEGTQTIAQVGDQVRDRQLREQFKLDQETDAYQRNQAIVARAQQEIPRMAVPQLAGGRATQTVFGVVGNPLRRGDFARLGGDTTKSWENITGVVIVLTTNTNQAVNATFDDMYMVGGGGPDTTEITSRPYDYRYTDFDINTGVESNPTTIQAESSWLDSCRQPITLDPPAKGAANFRQRFYRRGGTAQTSGDWFFVGVNSADGNTFKDTLSDDQIVDEATVEITNDQPVTSVNSSGTTVLNQTVPVMFAVGDYAFALGDTLQPQRLYRSKKAMPDAWPATEYEDVCAAGQELMNGCAWAGGGYVFSRDRMYQILINDLDGTWTTEPTACAEGLVGRWALKSTPYGIIYVSAFGLRLTQGGVPTPLFDEQIGPLFRGQTVNGFNPIDFTAPTALKVEFYDNEVWLSYQDQTAGARRQLVCNLIDKTVRSYLFGTTVATVYSEPIQGGAASLLLGSNAAGAIYTHDGTSDLGSAIAYTARTGAMDFGDPHVEKLLNEIRIDAEIFTSTLTLQAFLNDEATTVTAQTVTGTAGMKPYSFEPFGTDPQRARNVSVELRGSAPTGSRSYFNILAATYKAQPAIIFNEATPWEELPGGEGYLYGCIITCDTGGTARSLEVEYTVNNGSVTSAATLSITATGRRKIPLTWGAVLAQQVRIRPTGSCIQWIRYKIEWLVDPEPPRIPGWNTNWQAYGTYGDKLLKGYLIECDTFNVAKTVVVDIDQSNAVVSSSITQNGRGIQHIAFSEQRGRLFRIRATDTNYGKLYKIQPIFDQDPLGLTRWESQERPYQGMAGRWQKPLEAFVTLRSSGTVTWTITSYGPAGVVMDTSNYTIASTGSAKQKVRVPFNGAKGLLFKHVLTASAAFNLYGEESEVSVEDWQTGEARWIPLVDSNDDLDPARRMGNAALQAATPGGSS